MRAAAALLPLLLVGLPANAADPPPEDAPSESERAEAKRLFDAGRAAFRRGEYSEAIEKWNASLALSGEPLIHYNIGNAHERRGDLELAMDHFEKWLDHAPEAERPDLEARIEKLRERLATRPPIPEPTARLAPPPPPPNDDGPDVTPPVRLPPPVPTVWPTVGWVALGVGSAATLTGVGLAITAGVTRPNASEACVQADQVLCRSEDADAIRQSNLFANIGDGLWIGGAVVAAAGISILVFAPAEEPGQAAWTMSIDGLGASVHRSF